MDETLPSGGRLDVAARYELLLELSPDAIAVHQDGRIVFVNRAAVRFADVDSREDMIGESIARFVHPDSVQEMFTRLVQMGDRLGEVAGPDDVTMIDVRGRPHAMQVTSVLTIWDERPAYQVILRDVSAQKQAAQITQRQAALLDHVRDSVIACSRDGVIDTMNSAAEDAYRISAAEAVGQSLSFVVGDYISDDPQWVVDLGGAVEAVQRRRDGTAWPARVAVSAMDTGYLVVVQAQQTPLDARLAAIFAALDQALLLVRYAEGNGVIELANPAATDMLGTGDHTVGMAVGSLPLDFLAAASPIDACGQYASTITDTTAQVIGADDGSTRWVTCSCCTLDDDGPETVVLVSLVDITDRHHRTSELAWQATHDHLTGALSRAGIIQAVDTMLTAAPAETCVAALYLDLDGFKCVNDTLGHLAGDLVLCVVAQRLHGLDPDLEVTVGRLGGDEFLLLASVPASADCPAMVEDLARRASTAVSRPIEVYSRVEQISASVGAAVTERPHMTTATRLMREADTALYRAKQRAGSVHIRIVDRQR